MSEQIYNVIIGTAGHIDHGKSTLVKTLTGVDPDRLPEEKERGMTIDLGFAPYILKNGLKVGIIDVPGHEKFVKNMIAGAVSIDLVILVIAANDGIMPQTVEHLNIMQLLNIKHGFIVVTKIDLVDNDTIEILNEEMKDLIRGTFLEKSPIVYVSFVNQKGIDELKRTLEDEILKTQRNTISGVFKMSIQRVFSAKGHGTIVTGVPVSGSAKIGDALEILPGNFKGKVRGLQAYKNPVKTIKAGHSSAINLSDVDYKKVRRGFVVAAPGYLKTTNQIFVYLKIVPDMTINVKEKLYVRFHTGTSEIMGTVNMIKNISHPDEKNVLSSHDEALAYINLEDKVACNSGDFFIIRLQSPMITIGGGIILFINEKKLRSPIKKLQIDKERFINCLIYAKNAWLKKDFNELILFFIRLQPKKPLTLDDVAKNLMLTNQEVERIIERSEKIIHIPDKSFTCEENILLLCDEILKALEKFHSADMFSVGFSIEQIQKSLLYDKNILKISLDRLLGEGKVEIINKLYALKEKKQVISSQMINLINTVKEIFNSSEFNPPGLETLISMTGSPREDIEKVLKLLVTSGDIVHIKEDLFLHKSAFDKAKEKIIELTEGGKLFTPGQFRDAINSSRRIVIPLLEYFDHINLTVRKGNYREKKK